ncbi:histidine phosphatase family protein [Streptomyces aidingensis]|uniref:Broad specificity phosphatase PhoE n=1 Tax=Streptomyces aidingensis TaxID=910347 RepID=A0A1I1VLP9_9ACTN|nr:histidine phosphatase family protein [Streptomyces aidingensis]SFD81490.1 Broad specificity phosphatase PhoE [Streptomyces aidingensis]
MTSPNSPPPPLPFRCPLAGLTAVRHGQSTANVAFATDSPLPPDLTDPEVPLTPLGVTQSEALGRLLASSPVPDLVLASPFLRTRQTWGAMSAAAGRLGASLPPLLTDERLRDRDLGRYSLLTPSALRARDPRARPGDWFYRPPGGESFADVSLRVRNFLTELGTAAQGRDVLLITHDAVIVSVHRVLLGLGAPPPDTAPVPNASRTHWTGTGGHLVLARWAATTG